MVHITFNIEEGSQVSLRMMKICGNRVSTAVFRDHTNENSCRSLNKQETSMERRAIIQCFSKIFDLRTSRTVAGSPKTLCTIRRQESTYTT